MWFVLKCKEDLAKLMEMTGIVKEEAAQWKFPKDHYNAVGLSSVGCVLLWHKDTAPSVFFNSLRDYLNTHSLKYSIDTKLL